MNVQEATNLTITEGEVKAIHDSSNRQLWGRLNYDTKYAGYTTQNGTPTPDAPVAVNVVTGTQIITLTDGEVSDDYTVTLGSTELVKIGAYQDYIYKSDDDWYVHKAIGKVTFNGTENWTQANTLTSGKRKMSYDDLSGLYVHPLISTETMLGFSSHFVARTEQQLNNLMDGFSGNSTGTKIFIYNSEHNSTADDFKTWLSSNNVTLYYVLVTPTDTQIVDTTLVGQLNAIHDWLTRYGYTATVAGNLPLIISQTALT